MKLLITTTALFLLLGTSAFAMQSQDDKDKPKPAPKEQPRKEEPRKQDQPDRDRNRPQQDRDRQDRDRTRDQQRNQPQRDDRNRIQAQERGEHSGRQSAGRGRRIPDDRFRSSFGREHSFHVQRGGGGGGGDQRFQYGGYWFEYTDAWPDDWGYDDNFYIDYVDDDYYLYDRRHPGVRILVIVVE